MKRRFVCTDSSRHVDQSVTYYVCIISHVYIGHKSAKKCINCSLKDNNTDNAYNSQAVRLYFTKKITEADTWHEKQGGKDWSDQISRVRVGP